MKGGKSSISRAEELFQKLLQGDKLKNKIIEIRNKFEKSIKNFSYSPYKSLLDTKEESIIFREDVDKILKKSALPINKWWQRRLITFVLSDDKYDFLPPLWDFETPFIEISEHHVDRDGSYNDIRIYERATQGDVIEFITKNWKRVRASYRVGTLQRIRKEDTDDYKINKEIVTLMDIPDKTIVKGKKKVVTVSDLVSHNREKKITPVAVKGRNYRTRKKTG